MVSGQGFDSNMQNIKLFGSGVCMRCIIIAVSPRAGGAASGLAVKAALAVKAVVVAVEALVAVIAQELVLLDVVPCARSRGGQEETQTQALSVTRALVGLERTRRSPAEHPRSAAQSPPRHSAEAGCSPRRARPHSLSYCLPYCPSQ